MQEDSELKLQNNYQQDGVKRLIFLSFVLVIVNVVLLIFIALQYTSRPSEQHFYLEDGKLFPLQALNEPNLSTNTLLEWTTRAATDTYTYDFSNYSSKINQLRKYYTEEGYQSLLNAISSSGNFKQIKDAKLVVSAVPKGVPVIISEGTKSGNYMWLLQIPLLISYKNASSQKFDSIVLRMLVERVPTELSAKGIGISQIKIIAA